MKTMLGLTMLLVLLVAFAHGQTCYVSNDGIDDVDCGNETDPCINIGLCIANPDVSQIFLNPGTYQSQNDCNLQITRYMRIEGLNATADDLTPAIIDCQKWNTRHMEIWNPYPSFAHIKFRGGRGTQGGCILIPERLNDTRQANVHFDFCSFQNCQASQDGGAVLTTGIHKIFFTNVTFINNFAAQRGGAVFFTNSSLMVGCTFQNNTAFNGGAIHALDSFYVDQSTFVTNYASFGGAISAVLDGYDAIVYRSTLLWNSGAMGGAFFITSRNGPTKFRINQVNVTSNYAIEGGAIAVDPSSSQPVSVYALDSIFQNNIAVEGGFLYISSNSTLADPPAWTNNDILGNMATHGNEIYVKKSTSKEMSKLTLPGIIVEEMEDAIYCEDGTMIPFCQPCQMEDCGLCMLNGTCRAIGQVYACYSNLGASGCQVDQTMPLASSLPKSGISKATVAIIVIVVLVVVAIIVIIAIRTYTWKKKQRRVDQFVELE